MLAWYTIVHKSISEVLVPSTLQKYSIYGWIYRLYIRPSPIYLSSKLIYCLYIVHKSVSEVLVPSTFQKYSIYISVPQKITLKKSLRQKGDDFFTEKGDFSSDSQKFVEILVNEKVIFQVICYKWWLFCRNSSHHFWWQFCHLLKWRFVHRKWWIF